MQTLKVLLAQARIDAQYGLNHQEDCYKQTRAQPRFSQGGITLCQTESTHQFSPPEYCSARGVLLYFLMLYAHQPGLAFGFMLTCNLGFFFRRITIRRSWRTESKASFFQSQISLLRCNTTLYNITLARVTKKTREFQTFLPGKFGSREGLLVYLEGGADPDF